MNTDTLQAIDLEQFTGTEEWHKHPLGGHYTGGVKYVAEKAQAYWLLDAIFSYRRTEEFQIWTLTLSPCGGSDAVLIMREDSDQPEKVRQEIEYTDFPLSEIKMYLIDGVLLLPSEY